MYIHLGEDVSISDKNIIGIFDMEKTTIGKSTNRFFERATKEGRVVNVSYEMPKSFIVCQEDGREIIYISQISVSTLKKRSEKGC